MIYRYTGDGSHYPGVPARDLSAEDVAALRPEQQADVRSGHIYRAEAADQAEPAAPPDAAPAPDQPPAGEYVVEPPAEGEPHEGEG